ncbi:hypothetical protein [Cellvibrio sp. pealriver]|uniref:hypothetical protein n=1 Tax=Cellvibrio sp. pealriver TaxID=1622269 RepID=UPI00066FC514|nr:hypothetical protein [Cellvibrio sp. pealriver]
MATHTSVKSTENGKLDDISMSEAIAQFKEATSSIYDAVGSIGSATAANAKVRLNEGKARAIELEEKAEEVVRAKPMVTVAVAFAAGWLVSHLLQRRS